MLQELRRVLKTGGVLRLSLPDFEKALQAYTENDPHYFLIPDEEMKSRGGKLITQLLWRGAIRTIFITDFVEEMLFKAGFSQVHRCSFQTTQSQFGDEILELDDRPKESLFIEAVK